MYSNKYEYALKNIILSIKSQINFLKRNELSQDRIDELESVLKKINFYLKNYDSEESL